MDIAEDKYQEVFGACEQWALTHPASDEPVINLGKELSPNDIVREVREKTEIGMSLVKFVLISCERFGKTPGEIIIYQRED